MSKNLIIIAGGGGGGKGASGQGAVEAPNTLRSKQIAHIIDLLGEGEWEGLIDGPAGIYLNDVPLFSPTAPTGDVIDLDLTTSESGIWPIAGTWNYLGITAEFRAGTQSQPAIKSTSAVGSSQVVGLPVIHSTPIVVAVTNPNMDVAVVNIQVNSLYQQSNKTGDISGYRVDLKIEARLQSGSYQEVYRDSINGKAMSPYVRSYAIDLEAIDATGPWDIRVTRLSVDDATANLHSAITFLGVDLRSRDRFRYPNSVLVSLGVDASQLASIPARSYDVKMMRIRIPSNYNPVTRAYTGTWDGTFTIAWSDNPAWCMYEMATNERFGLGAYFDENLLDKWTLYTIAQYCDELVPDGFGGTEPRFTCNLFLQTAADAIEVLQNMASIFRGIVYYMGNNLVAVQEAPADPVYAFNTTNVKDGKFSYAGASGTARHTVAMVIWNNPEIAYKQDIEYVEDPEGLVKFGYRPITVNAMGCTSRGQAHRLGAWTLYVEQNESDVITFSTALEGTGVQPGHIVEVYDPARAGARMGGRILTVVGADITIDKGITLPAGTHTISYISDTGTLNTRTTTVGAGTFTALTLAGADPMPSVGSIFGITTTTLIPQLFRILTISEVDKYEYELTGVSHNPSKYDYIEDGLALEARPTSITSLILPPVYDITYHEALYILNAETVGIRLSVSWAQIEYALGYMVSYRRGSDSWSAEKMVVGHEFMLSSVSEGFVYSFRIIPVSVIGIRGGLTESSYMVVGEKLPPPPFDYFLCSVQPDGTRQFDWGYTTTEKPIDFKGARIRYAVGATSDWDAMIPLENEGFFSYSPVETNQLLSGSYTVAARAEDRTKNQSDPIFVSVVLPDRRLGSVLVEFVEEEEGWLGTKTSCHITPENTLEADDTTTWATAPATWDAYTRWNWTPASPIQYVSPVRDLVSVLTVLLEINGDLDGTPNYELRTSNDGSTWSAYGPASASYTTRYFQLRVTLTATGPAPVPVIRHLSYQIGGKVIKESLNDVVISALTGAHRIGTGDIRVPIANTYASISRVTVTAIQDANPGWEWLLVDRNTATGPRIKFYKNGVLADPAFVDFYIEGY